MKMYDDPRFIKANELCVNRIYKAQTLPHWARIRAVNAANRSLRASVAARWKNTLAVPSKP